MKKYPLEFRREVLSTHIKEGLKIEEIIKRFGITQNTFYRWYHNISPKRKVQKIDVEVFKKHLEEFPEITSRMRAEMFGVSQSVIHYWVKKLKLLDSQFTPSSWREYSPKKLRK